MRWPHFIVIQCLLILAVGIIAYAHKDKVIITKKPPASLAQWYKPENKRQVWLHTMFSLRREMQAAKHYAASGDAKHLDKWSNKLVEHYLKIGEMVPEWNRKLDSDAVIQLQSSVKERKFDQALTSLDKMDVSCNSCHEDYRVTTALLFRAPDFSSIEMTPPISFSAHMERLTQQVNQIKIFAEDGMTGQALTSFSALSNNLTVLGEVCSDCHKKDSKTFPSEAIKQTMVSLEESLQSGTLKDQGRYLGTLAVQACARCHATHRLSYDMRDRLSGEQKWQTLIQH